MKLIKKALPEDYLYTIELTMKELIEISNAFNFNNYYKNSYKQSELENQINELTN